MARGKRRKYRKHIKRNKRAPGPSSGITVRFRPTFVECTAYDTFVMDSDGINDAMEVLAEHVVRHTPPPPIIELNDDVSLSALDRVNRARLMVAPHIVDNTLHIPSATANAMAKTAGIPLATSLDLCYALQSMQDKGSPWVIVFSNAYMIVMALRIEDTYIGKVVSPP